MYSKSELSCALRSIDDNTKCIFLENNFVQHLEFPEEPLHVTTEPGPYCIPEEIFSYRPSLDQIFIFFFKGTPREIYIRQIFFHTPLTEQEQGWVKHIRQYCKTKSFPLRPCIDPFLLRICYFAWRKHGEKDFLPKAYNEILDTINWRAEKFPISDTEPDVAENINKGIAYWVARDEYLRPLLMIRLVRVSPHVTPQCFKRLILFCFEWAIRFLFVPGIVETCVVLVDARGVALRHFPISALTDITTMLTRQYPFRLHRMYVLNDSILVQTIWNVVRQFLSEVQQQKIVLTRSRVPAELFKTFSPLHIEKEYGGTRQEVTSFYPFPLLPGPFQPDARSLNYNATPNCWKYISNKTSRGVVWEGNIRTPIQWNVKPFEEYSTDQPLSRPKEKLSISSDLVYEEPPETQEKCCSRSIMSHDLMGLSNKFSDKYDTSNLSRITSLQNIQNSSSSEIDEILPYTTSEDASTLINSQVLVSYPSASSQFLKPKSTSNKQVADVAEHHHTKPKTYCPNHLPSFLRFNCCMKHTVKL